MAGVGGHPAPGDDPATLTESLIGDRFSPQAKGHPIAAPQPLPGKPFSWRFTAPLLLGSALNPINSSMIATALVGIGTDLQAGPGQTVSLISVLYVCSAVAQPTMGKLSTLFGPRRIFLIGVCILFVAGIIGAAAPAFGYLLVSRALIGIGTSACYPTAMALVRQRADQHGIGVPSRVLGNFSIASQVTVVVGLPLGGILAGTFGWRAIFAVNIPLALISIVLTLIGVAPDPSVRRPAGQRLFTALDVIGIVLFAGAITALLVFLSDLLQPTWWPLALAVILVAALIGWESRAAQPLIDVRMLGRNLPLVRTYLRQILTYIASYSALYGVSQWLEQGRGLSASVVGVILIPLSLVSILVAAVISGRGWVRWPLVLSGGALVAAAGLMLVITDSSSIIVLLLLSVLFGVTSGTSSFGNQAMLYLQSPAEQMAVAAGLLRTATYLGAIFSASLIGLAFGSAATDEGLHTLAVVLAALGVVLVAVTVLDRRIPRST